LFTSGFMIAIILLLDLEGLVKTASTLVLLLFIFVNLSLIMMRESKLRYYRPTFRSPFYPWIQIAGIIGYSLLIFEMGVIPLVFIGCFILAGFLWYLFFARDKIWREYSLLHVVERVTGEKKTGYLLDEELREILIERDDVSEKRFGDILRNCEIIDVFKYERPDKFAWLVANRLAERLDIDKDKLFKMVNTQGYNRVRNTPYGKIYKKIYNDIENGYYTHDDLIIFYIYKLIFSDDVKLPEIRYKNIKEIKKLFTEKQLKIDEKFILEIKNELKINNVIGFFKINIDGENIAYNLIKNKYISPIFYLKYYKRYLTKNKENNIFRNEDFIRFEKLINIINIIKEV